MTDWNGEFFSPWYPNNYPDNAQCTWTIHSTGNASVSLTFTDVDLEECCDYIRVYDGPSTLYPILGEIRDYWNQSFKSSNNDLTVFFYSDSSVTRKGFHAYWVFETCGGYMTDSMGEFFSPRYPNNYPDNSYCTWTIHSTGNQTVSLSFNDISLEGSSDYIKVYDGPSTHYPLLGETGNYWSWFFQSSNNDLTVLFHTDGNATSRGFHANWVFVESCGGYMTDSMGELFSPRYPNNYPDNSYCTWTIHSTGNMTVSLTFNDVDLETCCDYIQVYDGPSTHYPLLGEIRDHWNQSFKSSNNDLTVFFYSDHSVTNRGFHANWVFVGSCNGNCGLFIGHCACDDVCHRFRDCCPDYDDYCTVSTTEAPSDDPCYNYTVLDDPWRATDYPQNDSVLMCDQDMNWFGWYRLFIHGQSVQMPDTCVDMNKCGTHAPLWLNGGHPNVNDGVVTRDVCGHWDYDCCFFRSTPIRVKACPGNYSVYEFVKPSFCSLAYCADVGSSNTTYTTAATETISSVPHPECGGHLYGSGLVSSPNYPYYYHDNAYCVWHLTAHQGQRIFLTFADVQLERCCNCDYITVYDGPSTGYQQLGKVCFNDTTHQVFHSSSRYTTVVFRSDYTGVSQGFKALFTSSLTADQGRVDCSSDNMVIVIQRSYLNSLGLSAYDLYVDDHVCRPSISSTEVVFSFPLDTCGTVKEMMNGYVSYTNNVRASQSQSGEITRQSQFLLHVGCRMEPDTMVQIFYKAREITNANITGTGRFNASIAFYTSSSFYYQIYDSPYEVNLNQYLYVQVKLNRPDNSLDLFLDTCVASPNLNDFKDRSYDLLRNGCARDSTYYSYTSGYHYYARFRFQAFKFLRTHAYVYLQCKVIICPDNDYNSRCRQGCLSRRKRSLDSSTYHTNTVMLGPIKLKGQRALTGLKRGVKDLEKSKE
ncbi:deleted in malignant brain tumors 1 protein-like [Labeo rohita]|uniref:deleted in malignant brain tumors 1 protein-like n=1 Tax=Labeo rohita TaxID=84645 RepID=UPI0021E28487|nr:deleted in malignant brain tumors 1 protein-like [Labeo rohita]